MKINIRTLLIVATLIIFGYLISPLFKSGIPVNIDMAPHYLRLECLSESGIAPNNWCPYINAGTPTSQYYYPMMDQITVLLGKLIGLMLAYKIIIVLALLMPGIGAYLLLRKHNSLAATLAFCFSTLHTAGWHGAGFEETVLVGFWHYTLSIGFLLVSLSFFIDFINSPNKKNAILTAITIPFITHPYTIIFGIATYIALIAFNYKKLLTHIKEFITFGILTVSIAGFYWIPLLFKIAYLKTSIGGGLTWNDLYIYILKPIPWYLFALSFIGILLLYYTKDDKNYNVGIVFLMPWLFVIIDFLKTPLNAIMFGTRIGAFIGMVTIILAALCIDYFASGKIKIKQIPHQKAIATVIGIIIILVFAGNLLNYSKFILLSDNFKERVDSYSALQQLGPGRILAEEMIYNYGNSAESYTHLESLIPIYAHKEVITFGTYFFQKFNFMNVKNGDLFGKRIETWNPVELQTIFSKYNIKYAVVHTTPFISYFSNHSVGYKQFKDFILFDTGIQESYFTISGGRILSEEYKGTYAKAEVQTNRTATVIFKTNYYPNWQAYVNGKKVTAYSCDEIICADTSQSGTVEFKYELLLVDWVGYIVTIAGLLYAFYLIKKGDKK